MTKKKISLHHLATEKKNSIAPLMKMLFQGTSKNPTV